MKNRILTIFSFVLIIAALGFAFFSGFYDLINLGVKGKDVTGDLKANMNKGNYVTANVNYCGEYWFYSVKHTVNLIPVGTEYFYLINDGNGTLAVIRTTKNFGRKFPDGINPEGVKIRGKVRAFDSDMRYEFTDTDYFDELIAEGYDVSSITNKFVYIDCILIQHTMMRIMSIIAIVLGIALIFVKRRAEIRAMTPSEKLFFGGGITIIFLGLIGLMVSVTFAF